ncbi:MAG TPA: hypothetical protein VF192_01025 [Longimicrobiales bacterium]
MLAGGTITYAEARRWARWLDEFCASDLAGVLGCDSELGARFVRALLWHGICFDTGSVIENGHGPEPVIAYVPLPPGPKEHATGTPPELATPGVYSEAPKRGLPVGTPRRRSSTPGTWRPGRRQGPGKKPSGGKGREQFEGP